METQAQVEDWRQELNVTLNTKLKIADGETKQFTFLDEGKKYKHPDYKPSVIFAVKQDDFPDPFTWFVNAEAYGILNQIKILGKLTGVKVSVKRTGSKKSDTRYSIKKI